MGETPASTEGNPVTAIEDSPSTSIIMSDDQPALAQAFNRLADGLLNTKRTPPSPESGSLTHLMDQTPENCNPS